MTFVSPLADSDIRPALRAKLLADHANRPDTLLLEELGFCRGQVRIDLAVVNGSLHGFEIKSDRDSLRRLAGQVAVYGEVLERATLVVGERHFVEALEIVPDWWGILLVESTKRGLKFKSLRRGHKNPSRNPRSLVELLWHEEALALLEQRNATRGIRGKPRRILWDRVCEYFDLDEIANVVCFQLKARSKTLDLPLFL